MLARRRARVAARADLTMSPSTVARSEIADLAAIVVVGGRSSRMGRPKAWLELGGRPLLAHVVARARTWTREVVLVAAPSQDLPPLDVDPPPVVVRDERPGAGPLPALALGLASVTAPWALALACDTPLVRTAVIARLAAERSADVDVVVPIWDARPQPLVALYRRELAPALQALVAAGERRVHAVAAGPRVRRVPADVLRALDPEGDSFCGANTAEEFAALAARWSADA